MSIRTLVVSVFALSLFAVLGMPESDRLGSTVRTQNWKFRTSQLPLLRAEGWTLPTPHAGR